MHKRKFSGKNARAKIHFCLSNNSSKKLNNLPSKCEKQIRISMFKDFQNIVSRAISKKKEKLNIRTV
jgi:hypothetical protein